MREEDRKALREQWESVLEQKVEDGSDDPGDPYDPFSWLRQESWNESEGGMFHAKKKTQAAKLDIYGQPIGVIPRLTRVCPLYVYSSLRNLTR